MLRENHTNIGGETNLLFEKTLRDVLLTLEIILGITAVIGNIGVIYLIYKRRLLGLTTNIFVFSIAVADFVVGSAVIPSSVGQLWADGDVSTYVCKVYYYGLNMSKTGASYSIVFLVAEKALRILNPAKESISTGRCMFFICFIWFFSAAYNIWSVVLYGRTSILLSDVNYYNNNTCLSCFVTKQFKFLYDIFIVLDFVVIFVLPVMILVMFVGLVFVKYQLGFIQYQQIYSYNKYLKFISSLLVIFLFCHIPLEVQTFILHDRELLTNNDLQTYHALSVLVFSRGVWNLVIYVCFKKCLCRRAPRKSTQDNCRNKLFLEIPRVYIADENSTS